jgi:hypothetical protein
MNVHQSGKSLSIQADIIYKRMKSKATQDNNRYCFWSTISDLTSKLTRRGAGLVEGKWNRRFDYQSMFNSSTSEFWLIVDDRNDVQEGTTVPKRSFWTSFDPKF